MKLYLHTSHLPLRKDHGCGLLPIEATVINQSNIFYAALHSMAGRNVSCSLAMEALAEQHTYIDVYHAWVIIK